MKIVSTKDFNTGLTFSAIGLVFLYLSSGYEKGTASEMGPGFFPFVAAVLLLIVAAILVFKSVKINDR